MSDATPVNPMTAEDWAKSKTAAVNAICEAQRFANLLEEHRPLFELSKYASARAGESGDLWIVGPTFEARLSPERARELARWLDRVFPAMPGPQLVRDYDQPRGWAHRCKHVTCDAPVPVLGGYCDTHLTVATDG